MNLAAAISLVEKYVDRMNGLYGRAVFDEVAVVGFQDGSQQLHYYTGPRKAGFLADFAEDSQALRRELKSERSGNGGEFSFTREGDGSATDAYICLGADVYLFCNHTEKSMEAITGDPAWLEAQGEFLNLSQFFAVDPLQI